MTGKQSLHHLQNSDGYPTHNRGSCGNRARHWFTASTLKTSNLLLVDNSTENF